MNFIIVDSILVNLNEISYVIDVNYIKVTLGSGSLKIDGCRIFFKSGQEIEINGVKSKSILKMIHELK
ncbi:MAG: hypothetical protein GAK29_01454 [Acinetobacter bereziniae]|uniref:Uncharacterized protein n=1 Tax=Acinetobacter bereziniae TaxID=106648 RepID=A0A833PGS2_ACIBZ|nr:MAG: hypothetical protein GAK29_01454 [Acinetobacter bereziniae]